MKKLIAIFMCAALLFSLAACSNDKGDVDANKIDANVMGDANTENKLSRGKINRNTYTNTFVGFTLTKPFYWKFLSDEEIAERLNVGDGSIDLNQLEKVLNETATVHEMAVTDNKGNSIALCYENTMLTDTSELTIDEYIESFEAGLEKLKGFTYTRLSSEDAKLGDVSFKKLTYKVTVKDTTFTQAFYFKTIDKYVVSVVLSAKTEDIATMEAMFS